MKKKAFTLVELIVVITILAILWTIAFISLSWYSKEARDSKRITDTSGLLSKINIEEVRWNTLDKLITNTRTATGQILWKTGSTFQTFWKANFKTLKEDEKNFEDPFKKWQHYPVAYTVWGNWKDSYKFIQIATISEKENKNIIKWNYYTLSWKDAPSLFSSGSNIYTENNPPLVYDLDWPFLEEKNEWSCKNIIKWNWIFLEWNPLDLDSDWQDNDKNKACYVECSKNYVWNWISCLEVWVDPITGFKWQKNLSNDTTNKKSWAKNESLLAPTWNMEKYDFPTWNIDDYPAFKYCMDQWKWWRLPTKNELITLVSYNTKINWIYSKHPYLINSDYWSSDVFDSDRSKAWHVNFNFIDTYYKTNIPFHSKTDEYNVLCIHDTSKKINNWINNPDTNLEKRFWTTTYEVAGILAYKDSFIWNKYWEVNPFWNSAWEDAVKKCSNLWNWWRLPNIEELYSLLTYTRKNTDSAYSVHNWIMSWNYWSSTEYVLNDSYAWHITPLDSTTHYYDKDSTFNVICIHD